MGRTAYVNFMSDICTNYPDVFDKVAQFYTHEELFLLFPDDSKSQVKVASTESPLQFINLQVINDNPSGYSNEVKQQVMREGLTILDKRAKEEKSEFFTDNYSKSFNAPTMSGFA